MILWTPDLNELKSTTIVVDPVVCVWQTEQLREPRHEWRLEGIDVTYLVES